MKLAGNDMLVQSLIDEGVEYLFGYPGGAALHIYDAIFNQKELQHILVRHEQGATHAADGYARATGKPGVVLVTSGPGATNAITGIATAFMDSIPMVILSGQVASHLIGTDAFQETDMMGISRPIVKHSFLIQSPEEIPEVVKKAFVIAKTGKPGPVVIDVPKDMTDPNHLFDYQYPKEIKMRSYSAPSEVEENHIVEAVSLLENAKKPVLYAGGGIIQGNASEELMKLANIMNAPVTNTFCLLYTSPSPRDRTRSRMPSSA